MACYHQTCDAWSPSLDFAGAAQDADLFGAVARGLANGRDWPEWNPGSEFGAVRAETASALR